MKVTAKDQKFLYWTVIGSLLFMAFLHILNPLIQPPAPDAPPQEKIEAAVQKVVTLRASEVMPLLKNDNQKPTLVVVYASWCGYCKQLMPDLIEMMKSGKLSHINMLFLSIDARKLQLASYVAQYGYDEVFTPYQVKASAVNSLGDVLAAVGANYKGAIPYIAFLSPAGRMIGEEHGLVTRGRILDLAGLSVNP